MQNNKILAKGALLHNAFMAMFAVLMLFFNAVVVVPQFKCIASVV